MSNILENISEQTPAQEEESDLIDGLSQKNEN